MQVQANAYARDPSGTLSASVIERSAGAKTFSMWRSEPAFNGWVKVRKQLAHTMVYHLTGFTTSDRALFAWRALLPAKRQHSSHRHNDANGVSLVLTEGIVPARHTNAYLE